LYPNKLRYSPDDICLTNAVVASAFAWEDCRQQQYIKKVWSQSINAAMGLYRHCVRLTYLGHLRIGLENIRGLERNLGPRLATEEANDIKYNLKHKAWCISTEYSKSFKELVKAAEGEDSDRAKLIYLEALQDVNSVDEDRASFADVRAIALQRLITIYRDEGNLPAVERMWKQLADPRYPLREPDNAEVAAKLAHCYLQISAEGRRVFEELNLRVEAPLHSSADSLFPALHRALRCGDDDVSRVLCTTEVALMELDMLRQNTVIAAAATGKTALLGPILSCKPQLLTDRDVLDRTALFHAAHKGDFNSYLNLVRAGANIHDRDASGLPIISVAVARGCVKIVRDLLERGASPNPHTIGLPSPLHEAAKAGHLEMCEVLLAKGAWVDWRSPPDGKTPGQVAREKGFDAIATALERATQQSGNHFTQFQSTRLKLNQQDSSGRSVSKPHTHEIGAFDYSVFRPTAVTPQGPAPIVQQTSSAFHSTHLDHEPEHGQHTPGPSTTDSPSWISTFIASSTSTNANSVVDEQEYGEIT
jgi:ankyrin repeat protein